MLNLDNLQVLKYAATFENYVIYMLFENITKRFFIISLSLFSLPFHPFFPFLFEGVQISRGKWKKKTGTSFYKML